MSPLTRFALVPLYLASAALVGAAAVEAQPPLWVAGWAACTAAVLVPAALVEFRSASPHQYALASSLHICKLLYGKLAAHGVQSVGQALWLQFSAPL